MQRLTALLMAVWLGLHLAGYVISYALFAALPPMQAGMLAGKMFTVVAYVGLVTWFLVFVTAKSATSRSMSRSQVPRWSFFLLLLLAANQFLITPVIEVLRSDRNGTNWLHSLLGGGFGIWHGTSYLVYMAGGVIGLFLCVRLLRAEYGHSYR